jgi:hypothetical protein
LLLFNRTGRIILNGSCESIRTSYSLSVPSSSRISTSPTHHTVLTPSLPCSFRKMFSSTCNS